MKAKVNEIVVTAYEFPAELRCETCLYSDHCDGADYAAFCMLEESGVRIPQTLMGLLVRYENGEQLVTNAACARAVSAEQVVEMKENLAERFTGKEADDDELLEVFQQLYQAVAAKA